MQSLCKSRIKFIESPRVQENKARELKSQGINFDREQHGPYLVRRLSREQNNSLVAAQNMQKKKQTKKKHSPQSGVTPKTEDPQKTKTKKTKTPQKTKKILAYKRVLFLFQLLSCCFSWEQNAALYFVFVYLGPKFVYLDLRSST